ncbi:MAG: GNAT family N-acetyltransferase [Clostridiales bacterium]|nr:GNAT family N-acetyltransferase [Clostridiales bacterium]
MNIEVRAYGPEDLSAACAIWNRVVEDGMAFPQTEPLDEESGQVFFAGQSFTGVAADAETGQVVGLYILHPNNVGRCGHICNASYAVRADLRGQHIGETLVRHSLEKGRELGFRVLQFNAVVCSNVHALRLYEKLGFVRLGTVPGGFRRKDGIYDDIVLMYHPLV